GSADDHRCTGVTSKTRRALIKAARHSYRDVNGLKDFDQAVQAGCMMDGLLVEATMHFDTVDSQVLESTSAFGPVDNADHIGDDLSAATAGCPHRTFDCRICCQRQNGGQVRASLKR